MGRYVGPAPRGTLLRSSLNLSTRHAQTTGTYGMNYSLVSRDLIADCIETMYEAYTADAMITLSGCDKTIPGCLVRSSPPSPFPRRDAQWDGAFANWVYPSMHRCQLLVPMPWA